MAAQASAARQLRWSLLAGAAWFALVALAHTFGVKLPGLFTYFDLPSHAYQDQIIGFLAFGWSLYFYAAARDPQAARPLVATILAAGLAAVAGLAAINLRTDFAGLAAGARVGAYWLGCGAALAYWGWVLRLYLRMGKPDRQPMPAANPLGVHPPLGIKSASRPDDQIAAASGMLSGSTRPGKAARPCSNGLS